MSVPAWQKRCGEVNGFDPQAGSECHAPMRDLELEFEAAEGFVGDWVYEAAAYSDCALRLSMKSFNRWGILRNHRGPKPANDNGRSS